MLSVSVTHLSLCFWSKRWIGCFFNELFGEAGAVLALCLYKSPAECSPPLGWAGVLGDQEAALPSAWGQHPAG